MLLPTTLQYNSSQDVVVDIVFYQGTVKKQGDDELIFTIENSNTAD